eukprot:13856622-Alexandrium_andersonii.AAC.1
MSRVASVRQQLVRSEEMEWALPAIALGCVNGCSARASGSQVVDAGRWPRIVRFVRMPRAVVPQLARARASAAVGALR